MSTNDGGDPIRLSRDSVEKPPLPRGYTIIPAPRDGKRLERGQAVSAVFLRQGFEITIHDAEVVVCGDQHATIDIRPDTVITWDRISAASPQK